MKWYEFIGFGGMILILMLFSDLSTKRIEALIEKSITQQETIETLQHDLKSANNKIGTLNEAVANILGIGHLYKGDTNSKGN